MSTATVAGVEVDTRHWIGGRRVASPHTFDDASPIDGTVVARVSRGGGEEVDVLVRLVPEARQNLDALSRIPIASPVAGSPQPPQVIRSPRFACGCRRRTCPNSSLPVVPGSHCPASTSATSSPSSARRSRVESASSGDGVQMIR